MIKLEKNKGRTKMEKLSLKEKIGQMLIVGLESNKKEEIEKLIKKLNVGGVVIYRKNYQNYKEMINFVNLIKETNQENKVPIIISVDQEGGRVNRMPDEILNLKSATKIAKTKNVNTVKMSGNIIGQMLNETGISMDYAPILDIKRFEEGQAIGDRCYGENKEDVEKYAIEVMKQLQENHVIPVVKHFPGHGLTKKDSHFRIPKIEEKIEVLEKEDMHPFEVAIENGADAIMVGHLVIKNVDKKYPASLSQKVIQKYLIEKYNYKGLIITDDLKMLAIRLHYNIKEAVKRAILAGNDIIMVGFRHTQIESIEKYIMKEVKKGRIPEDKINKSVEKIIKMKEKYNITDEKTKGFDIEKMNKQIEELNNSL